MNEQQMRQQSMLANNAAYVNQSALEMRLDTKELLAAIQKFLTGEMAYTVQDKDTGEIKITTVKTGEPLANQIGINHIINLVSSIINPATVQGNYTDDWWRECLVRLRGQLAAIIVCNTVKWEIEPTARKSIMVFIMDGLVVPFTSRLIDNKERESYANTIRSVEASHIHDRTHSGLLNKVGIQ
jgi:hypothetical protein